MIPSRVESSDSPGLMRANMSPRVRRAAVVRSRLAVSHEVIGHALLRGNGKPASHREKKVDAFLKVLDREVLDNIEGSNQ